MTHRFARAVVRQAARLLADVRPDHARALAAEVEHIADPPQALAFASGGLWAALRMRLTLPAVAVLLSRLTLAITVIGFGAFHLIAPLGGFCAKIELLGGAPGACALALPAAQLEQVGEITIVSAALRYALMAGLGAILFYTTWVVAFAQTRAALAAIAAVGLLALVSFLIGVPPPQPPSDYVVQLTGLAVVATFLECFWRWDSARLAHRLAR
ncbi:hypothetical protein [Phenylobacterium sp.]|jgi:hypothetical protein|uniref:hypothetical protein n=1 Tax=Phenylobacterium sp. TaxID=1871053 RepID=UPI002F946323